MKDYHLLLLIIYKISFESTNKRKEVLNEAILKVSDNDPEPITNKIT